MDIIYENKEVFEIIDFLKAYSMNKESENIEQLLSYINKLELQIDDMQKKVDGITHQLDRIEDSNLRSLCHQELKKVHDSFQQYKNDFLVMENHFIDNVKDTIGQLKTEGKKALIDGYDKLNVNGILNKMKNGIDHLTNIFDNSIDRLATIQENFHQSKGYFQNAVSTLKGGKPKAIGKVDHDNGILANVQEKLFNMMQKTTQVSQYIQKTLDHVEDVKKEVKTEVQKSSVKERIAKAKKKGQVENGQKKEIIKNKEQNLNR